MEKSETAEKLADRLALEAQKCLEYFHTLAPQSWSVKIYTDGPQWNTRQLLAHFVSAEAANAWLLADILAGSTGAPLEFDIDAFNFVDVDKISPLQVNELLQRFIDLRQSTVAIVRQMNENDLNKIGHHPFLGQTKVEDIIKLIYLHDQIHIRDIKKVLVRRTEI